MAVEAHHHNSSYLFPPDQISRNWETVMVPIEGVDVPFGGAQVGGLGDFLYSSCSSVAPAVGSVPVSSMETGARKRAREQFCFRVEDLSSEFQLQQLEMDRLIAHHVEKVRWEVAERRRRQWRTLLEAAEEGLTRRLRAKEEELEAMGRLNRVLEERVGSLSLENQIWRELARSNEAAAQALRSDLAQALSQAATLPPQGEGAESCCGSCGADEAEAGEESGGWDRRCRACNSGESCVLLLPCRHLCLCEACGATLQSCPVCNSDKSSSLRVNMS